MCPLVGGPAVYKARALFFGYADAFFDNYASCNTAGIQFRQQSNTSPELKHGFTLFPNPNNGTFTVNWSGEVGESYIKIYDIAGRLVFSTLFSSETTLISIAKEILGNGIYLVKLEHSKTKHIQYEKLFINK